MSTSEHRARIEALQQNPELLREVENAWKDIGGTAVEREERQECPT
jgi:hypothetical protein